MPAQLREYCTQVEVRICEGVFFLAPPLEFKCALKVHEGCPQFSSFSIVASIIVVSDGGVLGILETKGLALLEEHEAKVKLLLLEQNHGDDVAKFT